jgi:hypothetical protein
MSTGTSFGRIWEGRWGSIGRPAIGAHTAGFNYDSFGVSLIRSFDAVGPTAAPPGSAVAAAGRMYEKAFTAGSWSGWRFAFLPGLS